jgi:DNA invertase Pin-like site-specific DNA recombinase
MATYSYLRVSMTEQNTEKNKIDILKFANEQKLGNVEFIEEQISGVSNYKKRKLGILITQLNCGDVLIVPELSRLARSVSQILEIINITTQKGVILYALKENFCNNDQSITATITSIIFALVAQIERELISARTREALQARKAKGGSLGRPKGKGKSKLDKHRDDIIKLCELNVPKTIIAKQYATSIPNLYRFLEQIKQAS